MPIDIGAIAKDYAQQHGLKPGQRHEGLTLRFDEAYCRRVASYYERAPHDPHNPVLKSQYATLMKETAQQVEALLEGGVRVRPWYEAGQPYKNCKELVERFEKTGELFVYLTAAGHGDGVIDHHPMRSPSNILLEGIRMLYNDLFRAVHDVFGHLMRRHSFQPRGEFWATWEHMQLYSEGAHLVIFSETIGQICTFFYGSHATDELGRPTPPCERQYPEQKVFLPPTEMVGEYRGLFSAAERRAGDEVTRSPAAALL